MCSGEDSCPAGQAELRAAHTQPLPHCGCSVIPGGRKAGVEKAERRMKGIYGQGNSVNRCLALGKFMNYLRNTKKTGCQKEGARHGGLKTKVRYDNVGPMGRAWNSQICFLV